jgi:hypothetical protein
MTVSHEHHELAAEEAGTRRQWIRPTVQTLAAGRAEDGSGLIPDAITNPS